jgi:gluconolactonase
VAIGCSRASDPHLYAAKDNDEIRESEASMIAVRDAVLELKPFAMDIDHPEGVARQGGAVWCGTEAGDLLRIEASSGRIDTAAHPGGFLLGLAFDAGGSCYICDAGLGRVVVVRPGGDSETFVDTVEGRRLTLPNYPAFGPDGTLWVTESGSGWGADDGYLFRVRPGREPELISAESHQFPNGLCVAGDGKTLYVVESRLPGVVSYSIGDGDVGPRQEVVRLPGTVPDGLALDSAGNLFISCWRPDRVYRWSPATGAEIYLDDPTAEYLNSPTNVCFGGDDLTRMFFAGLCGRTISQLRAEVPGQQLFHPSV